MRSRGQNTVTALGMALGLLLAGCGSSGEEPATLPPRSAVPTAAASASASPSPSASVEPSPPPTASTPEGQIEASVRRYFEAFDKAAATGDVSALEDASVPECGCRKILSTISSVYAEGSSFRGYETSIESITNIVSDPLLLEAQIRYNNTAYEVVNSAGEVTDRYDGESSIANVVLDNSRGYRFLSLEDALS